MARRTFAPLTMLGALLAATAAQAGELQRHGMPWDWSHRIHVQNPDTPEEAIARGDYEGWQKRATDPRFMSQLIRKVDARIARQEASDLEAALEAAQPSEGPTTKALIDRIRAWLRRGRGAGNGVQRDWANVMGGAAGVGSKGAFPAKYAFDLNATPSCANDFVVYGSGSAGVTGSGNFAQKTGTISGNPGAGNTVEITRNGVTLVLTASSDASAAGNSNLNFYTGGTNTTRAANLAAAINRNGGAWGVTASSAAAVVTLRSITQGASAIVADESLNNFSWSGGNDALEGGTGTAGQPTIFAVRNLYKTTCGGISGSAPVPTVYWSYNTGTGGIVETSPVLSLDGSQVAFIERNGAAATLVLLKWSGSASVGTIGAPTVPTTAGSGAAYRSCTAPCMYRLALGANNTRSSPYYDYQSDMLFVGAANGTLHKFTGVFVGNPAAAGSPWPVTVATGLQLSSPVYNNQDGLVYVGSERSTGAVGAGTGGRLHSVNAAGTVASTGELASGPFDATGGTGVAEAPIIDSIAQRAYVFVGSDTSAACSTAECQAVYQIPINASIAGVTGTKTTVGRGEIKERIMYSGSFSESYWQSTPTSPTGFLYVCGSSSTDLGNSRLPALWRIPITANVMGAAVAGPQLVTNTNTDECSPLTTVMNGANEFLFVSVPANGNRAGCTGACMYMFNLTGATWGTGLNATAGLPAPSGSGGIVVDNISSATGASQIYYATRASPGYAIQASQAALN